MKKRIVVLLTVVALLVAMMVAMAAPAFARINCAAAPGSPLTGVCSGGEGGQGGGGGGHRIENVQTSDLFFAYGHGGPGGGEGGLCIGPLNNPSAIVCHGSRNS